MLYACHSVYVQLDPLADFVYLKDIGLLVQRAVVLLRCNITCLNGSGGPRYVSEYTSISSYLSGERYLKRVHDNGIRSDKAGDCSVCLVRFFFRYWSQPEDQPECQGVAFLAFIFNEICVMNENTRVMFFLFDILIHGRIT